MFAKIFFFAYKENNEILTNIAIALEICRYVALNESTSLCFALFDLKKTLHLPHHNFLLIVIVFALLNVNGDRGH